MASSVFLHYVVGDLTLGKPEIAEFVDSETVEAAIRAVGDCAEGAITVWKKKKNDDVAQTAEGSRAAERFIGIINSFDLVAFLAGNAAGGEYEDAMRTPVSEVVRPNPALLREVDPGTRLIDALELMTQGVRRFLVRKSIAWRGVSKRFSVLYNGKWLKTLNLSSPALDSNTDLQPSSSSSRFPSSSSSNEDKYCCLSREDVVRFLIGCFGALAPIPLSPISSLGAINPHYLHMSTSSPAIEASHKLPHDPCAIAVVETTSGGVHKIVGEISAYKLWKCDYMAAAWAMANLSAGQFVMGTANNDVPSLDPNLSSFSLVSSLIVNSGDGPSAVSKHRRFSSRSIGFRGGALAEHVPGGLQSMYRGRSAPLTCKVTSSLAAVMAQMLSHRATHIWVTDSDEEDDDILIGLVGYNDILHAVIRSPGGLLTSAT